MLSTGHVNFSKLHGVSVSKVQEKCGRMWLDRCICRHTLTCVKHYRIQAFKILQYSTHVIKGMSDWHREPSATTRLRKRETDSNWSMPRLQRSKPASGHLRRGSCKFHPRVCRSRRVCNGQSAVTNGSHWLWTRKTQNTACVRQIAGIRRTHIRATYARRMTTR